MRIWKRQSKPKHLHHWHVATKQLACGGERRLWRCCFCQFEQPYTSQVDSIDENGFPYGISEIPLP